MKATATSSGLTARQMVITGAAVVAVVGSGVYLWTKLFPHTAADDANQRMYICSETLKTFSHNLTPGETEPIKSPFSGKNTGYRAEPCYWTKDGRAKKKPHWVLVKQWMGQEGKTLCDECGREVTVHNRDNPRTMPSKELMDAAE